jgi:hypothetical protein
MGFIISKDIHGNEVMNIECDECHKIVFDGNYNVRSGGREKPKILCLPCYRKMEDPASIDHIQEELRVWTRENFDKEYPEDRLVVGLYYMAQLSWLQMKSARTYADSIYPEDVLQKRKEELGKCVLALMTYASDNSFSFFDAIRETWEGTRKLDFCKYPMHGKPEEGDGWKEIGDSSATGADGSGDERPDSPSATE